jgi:hypothetical protein
MSVRPPHRRTRQTPCAILFASVSLLPAPGAQAQGAPALSPRPEPAAVAAPSWRTMATRDSLRPFGTLREQAVIRQQWLERRMETILPALMRKYGVDMWVIPMREYNEDPTFRSLVSPTTFAARRRTIYVFFDRGAEGIERIAFGGTNQGGVYKAIRSTKAVEAPAAGSRANDRTAELWGDEQWQVLRAAVEERQPKRIAINWSRTWHLARNGRSGWCPPKGWPSTSSRRGSPRKKRRSSGSTPSRGRSLPKPSVSA